MAGDRHLTAPDLSGSIAERISVHEGAVVVPPPVGAANRPTPRLGVLGADGVLDDNSVTWRGDDRVTLPPHQPPESDIGPLAGTWVFMGPLFGHFGHFMVETISRIWAIDQVRDQIDGAIFVPKYQHHAQRNLKIYAPLLEALGVTTETVNLEHPTRVERLYVPAQGFGLFQMIEGAPEFRSFVRRYAGKSIAPQGAEKIYISRSGLGAGPGCILGEHRLES